MHFDLEFISANNGWAMAITGAIIVMLGLSILSFIISQLHKAIILFERKQHGTGFQQQTPLYGQPAGDIDLLNDFEVTAKYYRAISENLGHTFEISKLYQLAQKEQLPHPHITIRSLRETGFLVPLGEGRFTWKNC